MAEYEGSGVHKEIRVMRARAENAESRLAALNIECDRYREALGLVRNELEVDTDWAADRLLEAIANCLELIATARLRCPGFTMRSSGYVRP